MIDLLFKGNTKFYDDATKELWEFRLEVMAHKMPLTFAVFHTTLIDIGEAATRLAETLSTFSTNIGDLLAMPPPIGCRAHHFTRMVGTDAVCFYCDKIIPPKIPEPTCFWIWEDKDGNWYSNNPDFMSCALDLSDDIQVPGVQWRLVDGEWEWYNVEVCDAE